MGAVAPYVAATNWTAPVDAAVPSSVVVVAVVGGGGRQSRLDGERERSTDLCGRKRPVWSDLPSLVWFGMVWCGLVWLAHWVTDALVGVKLDWTGQDPAAPVPGAPWAFETVEGR